jgi:outer membrane protein assembly factor BamB
MLKGNLSGFSLGEIFQSLAINRHTGTLTITTTKGDRKYIYFSKGEISLFSHGHPETPRVGEVLIRMGVLTREGLDQALDEQKKSHKLLGAVLAELGLATAEDISTALRTKIREEIFDLFLWQEGEFEFQIDYFPEELFDAMQKSMRVAINPNGVIMEGLRRLDEWAVISSRIKTFGEIFTPTGKQVECDALEKELLSHLDGRTTVEDLLKKVYATRFECSKALFDLLQHEAIRSLAIEELESGAAEATAARNHPQAAAFLRYATQLCPDEPRLFHRLGDNLLKFYQEKEARDAYLAALRLYFDQGDWKRTGEIAELLPPNSQLERRDLQILLETFIELKLVKKALWAGNQLAGVLQASGEDQKAADVLESLVRLDPDDLNLRVQVGGLLQKSGETAAATAHYEEVAARLEKQKKLKDLVKILRVIAELNPKRAEVKQKIAALSAHFEKLEQRKKRRVTLLGLSGIGLLICSVCPLLYEIKARELYSHAQRMEQIALSKRDYGAARRTYEELLKSYSFSTRVKTAKQALERLAGMERENLELLESTERQRKREEEARREAGRKALGSLVERAQAAEATGDFERAHALLTQALAAGAQLTAVRNLLLPVLITSDPAGARVEIDDVEAGRTPLVLRYKPDSKKLLRLSLKGCEPKEMEVVLGSQHQLHFTLPRRPILQITLPGAFQQPMRAAGGLLIYPARDGHIYGVDPLKNEIVWQVSCGRFGDLLSNLHLAGGRVYFGTVTGEVAAIDCRSGARREIARVEGPIHAAPATSRDGEWIAAANLRGEVFLIHEKSGKASKFSTENEIVARPLFAGDLLVAGSTDSHVYGYSLAARSLSFIRELSGPINTDPILHDGGVLFATADGRIHRLDPRTGAVAWSVAASESRIHSLLPAKRWVVAALSTGRVLAIEPRSGRIEEEWAVGEGAVGGMALGGDELYVTFESGRLAAWSLSKKELEWSWQAGAAIQVQPLVVDERLFVACSSGALQMLEITR